MDLKFHYDASEHLKTLSKNEILIWKLFCLSLVLSGMFIVIFHHKFEVWKIAFHGAMAALGIYMFLNPHKSLRRNYRPKQKYISIDESQIKWKLKSRDSEAQLDLNKCDKLAITSGDVRFMYNDKEHVLSFHLIDNNPSRVYKSGYPILIYSRNQLSSIRVH